MYLRFVSNHVLANLTFVLVLIIGTLSYLSLPRQQDPEINFNWIIISTALPGASAEDIEKKITDPIEDSLTGLADVKFISSNSREGISSLLVRFNQIDPRQYDKRLADLRRQIQSVQSSLPDKASDSFILEIVSSNAFPSATVLIKAQAYDENLRIQTRNIVKDIKRIKGVDQVNRFGQNDPELHINFLPQRLAEQAINPSQLSDSISTLLKDQALGKQHIGSQNWIIRLDGTSNLITSLNEFPILGIKHYIPLSQLAQISVAREDATERVSSNRQPAILLSITKAYGANTLDLIQRIKNFIEKRNTFKDSTGVELVLINDQSEITTNAINIMQTNALYGLAFVLIVTFIFLGSKISIITTIGIPFILAGTFALLSVMGHSLNVSVLLAIVIALGMLVDDAVVVAESIYYRIARGEAKAHATVHALKEVFAPVTTAVLTTMAAFLPLMLLPGILGEFMRVIPLVVTIALFISLVEAYWMLPAHTLTMHIKPDAKLKTWRYKLNRRIRLSYGKLLVKVIRWPIMTLFLVFILFVSSLFALASGAIKMDFFASDTFRLFYINLEMPAGSTLKQTHNKIARIEHTVRQHLNTDEYRDLASYAGLKFTETEALFGERQAQILVGLKPKKEHGRTVQEIIDAMRNDILALKGQANNLTFLTLSGGPPVSKPVSVKVRGEDYQEIRQATDELIRYLKSLKAVSNIADDASLGSPQLNLRLNHISIAQHHINPVTVQRTLQLLIDGEIVSSFQKNSQKTNVRVRSAKQYSADIQTLLQQTVINNDGIAIPLSSLVIIDTEKSIGNIRHYNFKRAITLEADIDKSQTDELKINALIQQHWASIEHKYPNISLDFSGVLDEIKDSLNAIAILFVFGVGLMYLILGTQFKSYFQPFLILASIPLAFIGVIIGILITKNPLSLYTLYGIVALAGIAVNSAIVLISSANSKLTQGMSLQHATIYAAKRRVIPILITTLTTIGGLLSLALGLGGDSLIWGPVANAIVWGLGVSATLTLFVIPVLYRLFMRWSHLVR